MSATAEISPAVVQAKQTTVATKNRLLNTFSFVPDEKLNFTAAESCKSPLRIVAHCGLSNHFFLMIIRGEELPPMTPELMEAATAREKAITTREAAIAAVEESTAAVLAALDELTPEQVASVVETPIFTAPMAFWMNLPGRHMDNHAAQIDFIQTCWGDMDWHM
jgi:hypothetical protein